MDRNRLRSIKMSTTTWTLICGEDAISARAKYKALSFPEQVSFQIEGQVNPAAVAGRGVMVTSSYPNGTKHTETISTEVARQLWRQWVDKGYNRWLTQKT